MVRTLLRTKLHWPRSPYPVVSRTSLLQRIDSGIEGDLTLVVAPAGYGKTTLVAEWAARKRRHVAWLALDEYDDDLGAFLAYVIAAIRTLYPDACPDLYGLLSGSSLPTPESLARILSEEVDDLPERFVLVVDDFHLATDRAIHQLVNNFLRHPPLQMHLLLTSRAEPPLLLSRLRANRRVNELRTHDLRFLRPEAEALLANLAAGREVEQELTALLMRTEGWIAGLQLVALTMPGIEAPRADNQLQRAAQSLGSANRFVTDYLLEQVFQRQSPAIQDFLLKTSILDRITPDLSRRVAGSGAPAEQVDIETLAQMGLFLNVLDERREWYAYHSLFRELLRLQLQTALPSQQIAELHRRASHWFIENQLYDEALQHAFAAGDEALAIRITVNHFPAWLEAENWRTISRRIHLFAATAIEQHPWLLMVKAHVLYLQSRSDALLPVLQQAEQRLAAGDYGLTLVQQQLLRGYLDVLWGLHWSLQADTQHTRIYAQSTLQILPEDHLYARGMALVLLTIAQQAAGAADSVEQSLKVALGQAASAPGGGRAILRPLLCLLILYFAEGHVAQANQIGQALLSKSNELQSKPNQAWAHLVLGWAAYEHNDLESAARHFSAAVELRHVIYARAIHESFVGLALTYHALGLRRETQGVLAAMADFHQELASPILTAEAVSLRRRLAVLNGDLDPGAVRDNGVPIQTYIWYGWGEIPALTRVQAALYGPDLANWAPVELALERLLVTAANMHKSGRVAALLALKAILHWRQQDQDTALHVLRQALATGESKGLLRSIADAGPRLEPLLVQILATAPSAYVASVRTGLHIPAGPQPEAAARAAGPASLQTVVLTRREREVLALLGQHLTDREVAEALVISPLTVRTHIENLSTKLSSKGRRAIVTKAHEHGLLS